MTLAAAANIFDEIAAALHLRFLTRLVVRHIEVAALPQRNRRLAAIGKRDLVFR
jgi:hypothetical protein